MTTIDRRYSVAEGTAVKAPVRVATTANITLSGLQSIDGVTVAAYDRVLVKNQTTATENGIYEVSSGNWLRTKDFDGAYDVVHGSRVLVVQGSENALREFYVSTSGTITIDTTSIAFQSRDATTLTTTVLKSILDYIPSGLHAGIAAGTDVTDLAVYIQAGLDAVLNVYFPPGTYNIADELNPNSKQYICLSPGAKIKQTATATAIFKATTKDNIVIDGNGGILYGEGTWDGPYVDHLSVQQAGTWTSNVGREERGINFLGCTNCRILNVRVQNCGNAGIAFVGGTDNTIINPRIEGTHNYSTSLTTKNGNAITEANLQNGIYLSTNATHGSTARTTIIGGEISGVGQGVMKEVQTGAADYGDGNVITGLRVHDIVGQHGGYWQGGMLSGDIIARDVALQGWKVQSGDANADIHGVKMRINAKNCSEALICAVVATGTGSVTDCDFDVTAYNCATGMTIQPANPTTGTIKRITARVNARSCTNLIDVSGRNISDIDIWATGADFSQAAIYVTATNSTGLRFRSPSILRPNNSSGSFAGIHVASASAAVEIYDPVIKDDDNKMLYGIFNATSGSTVAVYGSCVSTGATTAAIRADATFTEFPTSATLSSVAGPWFSGLTNIKSIQPTKVYQQTTSTTNQELWARTLDDETAMAVTAVVTGRLSGTAQRKTFTQTVLAYRDGAGAVVQGSAQDHFTAIESGSFAGVFAFQASGNAIQAVVNSGGSATYEWTAFVIAVPA